jgi:hypothetical protein
VYASGRFSKTGGGVIYGSDEGSSLKNTANSGDTNGHAVFYSQYSVNQYYRDTTLNAGDNISTSGTLPANSGDTLNNWTKK